MSNNKSFILERLGEIDRITNKIADLEGQLYRLRDERHSEVIRLGSIFGLDGSRETDDKITTAAIYELGRLTVRESKAKQHE